MEDGTLLSWEGSATLGFQMLMADGSSSRGLVEFSSRLGELGFLLSLAPGYVWPKKKNRKMVILRG